MYALVNLNGKQYQLEEGRYAVVDKLPQALEEPVEIGNVLMLVDGETTLVGTPYIDGVTIKAKVLAHQRGPKILVYKMRCKKGYRRKNGHRQDFTKLQVEVIDFPGKKVKSEASTQTKPKSEAKPKAAAAKPKKQAEPVESAEES